MKPEGCKILTHHSPMNDEQHHTLHTLALHASAVHADGGALLFLGPSGTGKSTMCHLLSPYAQTVALDAVYLIYRANKWEVTLGDGVAHKRSLSQEGITTCEGVPLQAIFRLHQAPEPYLQALDTLETCRCLTDAFFEIARQREDTFETKRRAFSDLAAVGRSVVGYRFGFDLSPQTLEILDTEIGLLRKPMR